MSIISLIAAVDEQGGLGKNNQLLCHLPADLKHFKSITMSKPIIMGRKTFVSIGRALPGRRNIVLTQQSIAIPEVEVVKSLEEAFQQTENEEEIMIIGGGALFSQTLELATNLFLTVIHASFDADVFFPSIDKTRWLCLSAETKDADEKNRYAMTFYHYQKN